jgi:hypothetical protein
MRRTFTSWTAAILISAAAAACAHDSASTAAPAPARQAAASPAEAAPAAAAPAAASPSAPMAAAPAQPSAPGAAATATTFSDVQLRSFAAASVQVERVTASHQAQLSGTPEQQALARQQMAPQLNAILQSNNIDATTYNAIARAARTDPALNQRIVALRAQAGATPPG